jgi:uncharacterized protein (DUF1501 family)
MQRREFLALSLYSALMAGNLPGIARAQMGGGSFGRTLINVMFLGGADLRHLFVPDPTTQPEYAARFWEARQSIYQSTAANAALYPDYSSLFNAADPAAGLYRIVTDPTSGASFGIHNSAGWLIDQFTAGNAAIIANTVGSDNRRHDHSQLIVNSGDIGASQYIYDRDGWGGRLAYSMANGNIVSVSRDISVFCNGIDASNRNAKIVHAKDTRNFGLSKGDADPLTDNSVTARALKAYYAEKRIEAVQQPPEWPYRKFLQHEESVRIFGDALEARLAAVAPQQPLALAALHTAGSGNVLNDDDFGLQCANVYDSFLAADLFEQRIVSMEYTGWDTHNNEKTRFASNINDVFGAGRGLATLYDELALLGPAVIGDVLFAFNTDFGRQLRANGDAGTDHGTGNYMIVVGQNVAGRVHGEMFPATEIQGTAGDTRYDQQGADIQGLTSFERVLAPVCDWVQPGSGGLVFPSMSSTPLELGVDLSSLLSA